MARIPQAVEVIDFKDILANKKAKLQELLPELYENLEESDPAIALLEVSSYSEGFLRDRINQALLACMVDFAKGSDLENLGSLYGIERKLIKEEDDSTIPPTPAIWESDNDLRARIKQAPKGFSVAGSRDAYIYYGLQADNAVKDISVSSPAPMEITVAVLPYKDSQEPILELVDKVRVTLSAEDVRPMGDELTVQGAEIIDYEVLAKITFIDDELIDKEQVLTQINTNLQSYTQSKYKLGSLVALSGLYASCFVEGVKDVELQSPSISISANALQAANCTNISVREL